MKKIKKRHPGGHTWIALTVDPPRTLDVGGLVTMLLLVDARSGRGLGEDVTPRPAREEELVEFVAREVQARPQAARPRRVIVESETLRGALAELPELAGVAVVVGDVAGARRMLLQAFSQAPMDPISTRPLVGTRHFQKELARAAAPLARLRPWEAVSEHELLQLSVQEGGRPLRYGVVSIVGGAGTALGLQLVPTTEDFEALHLSSIRTTPGMSWDPGELDSVAVWVLEEEEVGELAAEAMRRQGLALSDDMFLWVLRIEPHEAVDLEDRDQVSEVLRTLEALGAALEAIHARARGRDWPPYEGWHATVTLPDGAVVDVAPGSLEMQIAAQEEERAAEILASRPERILRMHISLDHTDVWRRVDVPDNLTLVALHAVIQRAMGWEFDHLWMFEHKKTLYSPDPEDYWTSKPEEDAYLTTIADVLGPRGKVLRYTYDFGDNWEHTLRVERRFAPEPGVVYPRLVDGARAAPPEDCGGAGGYERLVEGDPDRLEWVGGHFDPDAFDPASITFASGEALNQYYLSDLLPVFDEAQLDRHLREAARLLEDARRAISASPLAPVLERGASKADLKRAEAHLRETLGLDERAATNAVVLLRWVASMGSTPAKIVDDLQKRVPSALEPTLPRWLKRVPLATLKLVAKRLGIDIAGARRATIQDMLGSHLTDPGIVRDLRDRSFSDGARELLAAIVGAPQPLLLTEWLEANGHTLRPLDTLAALTLGAPGELIWSGIGVIGSTAFFTTSESDRQQRLYLAVTNEVREALTGGGDEARA